MGIIKRDGRIVPIDESRIADAVKRAAIYGCNMSDDTAIKNLCNRVVHAVEETFDFTKDVSVEDIQDTVEKALMAYAPDVARQYILYRKQRTDVRESKTKLQDTLDEILNTAVKDSNLLRENGNINGNAPMAKMLRIGSESSKDFYLRRMISPQFSKAHREGYWHIHDLDFYALALNCCQIDLGRLLKNGFSTGHGYIRPPKSIRTAASLACIVLQSNQNDMFGGQSLPNLDYDLAPYVGMTFIRNAKKLFQARGLDVPGVVDTLQQIFDDGESVLDESVWDMFSRQDVRDALRQACAWTEDDTYQAMEAFIFNLNTMHSRAGAQTPFTSVSYGTCTTPEGRMIIKCTLEALEAGLGNGETPIFPIHIFRILEGKNAEEGDPNHDLYKLSLRVSAKRLFPNWVFLDAPFNKQYIKDDDPNTYMACMGCRTRVLGNTYDPAHAVTPGRGNLSFTTLNLPRLAIEANKYPEAFLASVRKYTLMAFEQLKERFEVQGSRLKKNFPFLMEQGVWLKSDKLSDDDPIREVIKHGTMSVGFIGLAEAMVALFGKHHGEDGEVAKFAYNTIKMMRELCDQRSEEEGLNYSLFATPAEGLAGRFTAMDKKRFGIIPGVTDREYYTNSNHVPVYYPISAEDKIRIEAPYHELCNAGDIIYVEMDGDPTKNLEAMDAVVQYMRRQGISYGAINHPSDRCPECGYVGVINDVCPQCHRHEYEHMSDEMHSELVKKGVLKE